MYSWPTQKSADFLSKILDVCQELKVDTVAGPVLSGSVMAMAVAVAAWTRNIKIRALMLPKLGGAYAPAKHCNDTKSLFCHDFYSNIMIIDDVASSGDTILHCIKHIERELPDKNIVAIAISCYCNSNLRRRISRNIRIFNYNDYGELLEMRR